MVQQGTWGGAAAPNMAQDCSNAHAADRAWGLSRTHGAPRHHGTWSGADCVLPPLPMHPWFWIAENELTPHGDVPGAALEGDGMPPSAPASNDAAEGRPEGSPVTAQTATRGALRPWEHQRQPPQRVRHSSAAPKAPVISGGGRAGRTPCMAGAGTGAMRRVGQGAWSWRPRLSRSVRS